MMQSYQFQILNGKGKIHVMANAWSRLKNLQLHTCDGKYNAGKFPGGPTKNRGPMLIYVCCVRHVFFIFKH
jgi:hypothetical protein